MAPSGTAIFTRGPLSRHILIMTGVNATGLPALVSADMVDMYFLSLLGQAELAAAVGFSGILMFFLLSTGSAQHPKKRAGWPKLLSILAANAIGFF